MALTKQPVTINFGLGLDTKSDPYQVPIGSFLTLVNSVFTTGGRLTKRNGFSNITTLPNADQTTLTTFNSNLVATGSSLYSFNADNDVWLNQGIIQPIGLNVESLVRRNTPQQSPDMAVAYNGLACLAYVDSGAAYYQIADAATGAVIVGRTALPATATNPRVFLLGAYFIVTFTATVIANTHLRYIAIPINNVNNPSVVTDIGTQVNGLNTGYDGAVSGPNLYMSWGSSSASVQVAFVTNNLVTSTVVNVTLSHTATLMSVAIDQSTPTPVIYTTFWDAASNNGYTAAWNHFLMPVLSLTQVINNVLIREITSLADNMLLNIFYENVNYYNSVGAYPTSNIQTDFISKLSVTQTGTVSSTTEVLRSVGLASKPFQVGDTIYMLVAYGPPQSPTLSNQPSYFLIDSSGNILMRLAYSNGGGYAASQVLPSVTSLDNVYYVPYQIVDLLASVNKNVNLPSGTQINNIYTQTGLNLAQITINSSGQFSNEIADALHLTGGQLWEYDGVKPVEHGFEVWPEDIAVITSTTGGSLTAQKYFYQFTYEWTDNSGMLHRSAPSIPFEVDLSSSSTSTNSATLYVPTLRLTLKTGNNPVRIVGYRWSTAQEEFFQFTSLTSPSVNDTTVDYVTIVDLNSDADILGNNLIYTTGGVIENIAAPASIHSALFGSRLFLIDAEDRNLVWYSKQVIESTPVEMSDLFTIFVAPTTGAQGSTGPLTALFSMDDKLILFKRDAIYYITGTGPDSTGANNDFSPPIFVTANVGCSNPKSLVMTPNGIMFQSDKGIWLLGRDLSTQYVGAGVEAFNSNTVNSAQAIPGTNQVRFILSNFVTLMYDYFYNQWGTFTNVRAISATLYQSQHTYLNSFGQVLQETPGVYTDASDPVLMSFTTSWINAAGLRGYERLYYLLFLGTYITPFKLNVGLTYDYAQTLQNIVVTPDNFTPNWGGDAEWGSNEAWGGPGNTLRFRVFPQIQKCESFQISVSEVFDASHGTSPGAGLTLSGLNMVIGVKKGYGIQRASRSFG